MERYLKKQLTEDLVRKMVFLGGPRQVGKTTLALEVLGKDTRGYLNWDIGSQREKILKRSFANTKMWVFDELHKYKSWRNFLKGLYDEHGKKKRILVTGSARLDLYRRGGDSLQGRYHYLRLHPLSVAELGMSKHSAFLDLLTLGGFPEPFYGASQTQAKRWSLEYRERLIRDDVRELEQVSDLGNLELLTIRLPELVGNPLSINALREDLQVSHRTVSKWLFILERLYHIFRIAPLGATTIRAVKKEAKHYQWDWSLVEERGFRFENLVACHLLKWIHYQHDSCGELWELRYFRDRDGREVDFVLCKGRQVLTFIECKYSEKTPSPNLSYLKRLYPNAEYVQLLAVKTEDVISGNGIRVCSAWDYLKQLA